MKLLIIAEMKNHSCNLCQKNKNFFNEYIMQISNFQI